MGTVDDRLHAMIELEAKARDHASRAEDAALKGGGGGGTSGGMESRIAKLESDMGHVKQGVDKLDRGQDDLRKSAGDLKVQGATIVENMRHLPTKPWIFSVCLGLLAAIGGIVALIVRFMPHA